MYGRPEISKELASTAPLERSLGWFSPAQRFAHGVDQFGCRVPNVSQPLGIRDRALLEVLYRTGVRVGELERVTYQDVDLREGTMHLRFTKGGQPR
jgi:integrase